MTDKTTKTQDQDLFRQSIGDVVTVKSDKLYLTPNKKPSAEPREQDYQQLLDPLLGQNYEQLSLGDSLAFIAPGQKKNILKKMHKGHFGIAAEIDLHGLSHKYAQHQLLRFLYLSSQNGWRCVRIIHGKGHRSADQHPVLKNSLNQWLRQHCNVLAFCSAKAADGGTGAAYVLLKLSEKYRNQKNTEY